MAFFNCMLDAIKKGAISKEMLKGLEDHMEQHGIDFNKETDFDRPEVHGALEAAIRNYDEQTALRKKQLVLAVKSRGMNEDFIKKNGGNRPIQALITTLENIRERGSVIRQQIAAPISDFFKQYAKGNFLGNLARNEADRDLIGREMITPGSTGSAVHSKFAKAIQDSWGRLVLRQADAGMDIKPLSHYGLPTNHDGVAIGKAGFDKWKQSAVANFTTIGGKALSQIKDLNGALDDIYKTIQRQHAGLEASDTGAAHRVIGINDYDKWKAYNKDFGMSAGDPVNAIESHFRSSTDNAAMLEQFGPAPQAMVKHLRDYAFNAAADIKSDTTGAKRDLAKFDAIWNGMTHTDSPLSFAGAFYKGFRSAVYMRIAEVAYMSQASVDLISRIPTLKMMNNMPASSMLKMFSSYGKGLASDDFRQLAIRSGVAGDNIFSELHKGSDQIIRDHPIMGRVMSVNDPLARTFFVHAHMETLPRIMGLEFLSNMARWKDMAFNELPIKASMERANISERDWDLFRQTELADENGVKMLRPVDMLNRTDLPRQQLTDVATRMGMYINGEARETVPAPNLRNTYALSGHFDPNSVAGMIVKDSTIAMQFTMSTMTMLYRGFMMQQGALSKIKFAAASATALMLANSARMQMKAIADGRDFYDMNPETEQGRAFWKQCVITSGFAGPAIDLLNPNHTGSVSSTIGKAGTALWNEGAYKLGMTDKDPNAAGKIFNMARHFVPGADGWWAHGLMQNGILDNVQSYIDPQAQEEWDRTAQFYQNNYGQDRFHQHGDFLPSRAPK